MRIKEWVLARIRDDQKHAELDERERKSDTVVDNLRTEVTNNGFGQLFDRVTQPASPKGKHP